eukprot:CAMPEP_0204376302 /NCGR_PEP_ID=MMETSP0469-20131031/49954_1 /ASSEMBLY_ACC=CAM_ASM_000384 /TAXON_ID=2969 /ORGANISM="Oxyrrhis marina" /LENGTH=43 /DNA_ID= /DNA_START= /DNA_END= /DNA_ORIENTATION=
MIFEEFSGSGGTWRRARTFEELGFPDLVQGYRPDKLRGEFLAA